MQERTDLQYSKIFFIFFSASFNLLPCANLPLLASFLKAIVF